MAERRGNSFRTWLPLPNGGRKHLTLGTPLATVARDMERMIESLKDHHDWELLEAMGDRRLKAWQVLEAWRQGDAALTRLRERLQDLDLHTLVPQWVRWLANRGVSSDQAARYEKHLGALLTIRPFARSALTKAHISQRLTGLPVSSTTAYQYWVSWNRFATFLVETDVLPFNPAAGVTRPRKRPPRDLFLELDDVQRLVEAQPEPYRTLAALRESTGAEISAALKVRQRDVDLTEGIVLLRGTKSDWRTRPALIEPWARPYLAAWLQEPRLPEALLFPDITRYKVRLVHKRTLKALALPLGYRVHDSRHSFPVRWMRAGIDPQVIANQLGHRDATLVMRVYGRYRPSRMQIAALEMGKLR